MADLKNEERIGLRSGVSVMKSFHGGKSIVETTRHRGRKVALHVLLFPSGNFSSPFGFGLTDRFGWRLTAPSPVPRRPVVAVVLAGGSAMGLSHIGVLDVLPRTRQTLRSRR